MTPPPVTGGIGQCHSSRASRIISGQLKPFDMHGKFVSPLDVLGQLFYALTPSLSGSLTLADMVDRVDNGFIIAEIHGKTHIGLVQDPFFNTLHQEADDIALGVATEAVVELFVFTDGERG